MVGTGFYWKGTWVVVPPVIVYLIIRAFWGSWGELTRWWERQHR